jgi:hypothetical protein
VSPGAATQLSDLDDAGQRAVVDDRDVRSRLGQHRADPRRGDARGDEHEIRILVDQGPQSSGDDVLEGRQHD